ncbi:MAG: carboxypeptidase M32 [Candidatus Auribacterota bacterium]|jgi:carboxypeptidase Taq|nr:carboxypeptidase M32 [Candidatus Auribacterota bacterium]
MKKDLSFIYATQKDLCTLYGIGALLGWDERTHMPRKAVSARADQQKLIHDLIYEKMTADKLLDALHRLREKTLSGKDNLVVKELYKDVIKARRIPQAFCQELVKTVVMAQAAWEAARYKNNFALFRKHLEKVVELKRQEAQFIDPDKKPYAALLNEFEEGMTPEKLTDLFDYLKKELITIVDHIKGTPRYSGQTPVRVVMKEDRQKAVIGEILKKMRMPSNRTSCDVSTHPFSIKLSENDVRITTRYLDPLDSFFAAIHEAGHALYELGISKKYCNTVLFYAASVGLHESQSRFWENMIAKNKSFWSGYFPQFARYVDAGFTPESFYYAVNQVRPSFIRVNADEVTYGLHIILRYEIERDLIDGTLSVADAKDAWNCKTKQYFNLIPSSDNEGILQDVHWAGGAFGYFPTYTIGSIYASQIYNHLEKTLPDFDRMIRVQNFNPVLAWLRANIHSKGKSMPADDIIAQACGSGLNPKEFVDYLRAKFIPIYER